MYRLEDLLHALQDLWTTGTKRRPRPAEMQTAYRRLQAIIGTRSLHDMSDVPWDTWFIKPSLVLGSMICNAVLKALETEGGRAQDQESREPTPEGYVVQLRNLLIALHDLMESGTSREDYPREREAAAQELAFLLGRPPRTSQKELIRTCFTVGSALATQAIFRLQQQRQAAY